MVVVKVQRAKYFLMHTLELTMSTTYIGTLLEEMKMTEKSMTTDIAALDPALAKRVGEVLEGVTPGPWRTHAVDDTAIISSDGTDVGTTCDSAKAERDDAYNNNYEQMEADARFIAWCREGVPALLAQNTFLLAEINALRARIAFTATDGQRLLRKIDVIGVCDDPDLCFDSEGSVARCGPCAVKIAARDGVALNEYTRSNPQAMRLRRELTAAEAQIATLTARVEMLREALKWYSGDPSSQGDVARDALSTTEEGHE